MKPIRLLAIVAILGLAATSIRVAQDRAADQAEIADLNARLADADKAAKAADAKAKSLQDQLAQADSAQTAAPGQNTEASAAAPAAPKKNPMAQLAQMMKNPAMHDMIEFQQKQAVQMAFGNLIKRFNLSPDERDQFVKLLTDRQMNQVDMGMSLMDGGNLTADDRAAAAQQLKDANAASDAQIQQFLNDDADYAYYQTYVQQQPERTELSMLNNTLAKDNMPLDSTQTDNLASLMYDARKNFNFTVNYGDPSTTATQSPASMTEQSVQTYEQQQEQLDGQIDDQATSILSPEQLEVFKQNQAQMRQITQMGLNMSRQMLGGGK
jgi:hypothetical protein